MQHIRLSNKNNALKSSNRQRLIGFSLLTVSSSFFNLLALHSAHPCKLLFIFVLHVNLLLIEHFKFKWYKRSKHSSKLKCTYPILSKFYSTLELRVSYDLTKKKTDKVIKVMLIFSTQHNYLKISRYYK